MAEHLVGDDPEQQDTGETEGKGEDQDRHETTNSTTDMPLIGDPEAVEDVGNTKCVTSTKDFECK